MIELVLAGPGRNALGTPVMERALQDLYAAKGEPLLVRGEGPCFSAGLNLKEIATLDADQMEKFLALLDTLVVGLLEHAGPVVACINGHAIAGGCVIALACDLRVCTSATRPGCCSKLGSIRPKKLCDSGSFTRLAITSNKTPASCWNNSRRTRVRPTLQPSANSMSKCSH